MIKLSYTILCLLCLLSCSKEQLSAKASLHKIDEQRAFSFIEKTVDFGSRYPGSQASKNFAQWLASEAQKLGFKSEIQTWKEIYNGSIVEFRNIIITVPPTVDPLNTKDFIVVGSHFDNKYLKDVKDWQSANDGPSSCGLLLEILHQINENPKLWQIDTELRFIFFDGEEALHEYTDDDGLYGSRYYVQKLVEKNQITHCRAMLLADMVADKDLKISFPKNNDKNLIMQAQRIAKENGLSQHFQAGNKAILDDFIPFLDKGIAVIDFIDFNYGPDNSHWHTEADTIDKLSPKSLKIVGTVFQQLIWELSSATKKK